MLLPPCPTQPTPHNPSALAPSQAGVSLGAPTGDALGPSTGWGTVGYSTVAGLREATDLDLQPCAGVILPC